MKTILLINPVASAEYLCKTLRQANIYTVGLYTVAVGMAENSYIKQPEFDKLINITETDIESILKHLDGLIIDYVLNCNDASAKLGELLINALTPSYNTNIADASIKGNKYQQQIILRNNGLPSIKQVLIDCNNVDLNILADLEYPVFAKPINGAASIGVFSAQSSAELLNKLNNRPRRILSEDVTQYLVQEFISGDEIVVDSFSINGKHYISNVYIYTKEWIMNSWIYRYVDNVLDLQQRQHVIDFTLQCLNVCKVENGFAHVELFRLADNSLRLIEINPRISGGAGCLNKLTRYLGGIAQDELLIQYLNNGIVRDSQLPIKSFGKGVFLYNNQEFDFTRYSSFKENIRLQTLPMDLQHHKTISVLDIRQIVILASDSGTLLEEDYRHLLEEDIL